MVTDQPTIHFYLKSGESFADRVLCHPSTLGLNTHVTEDKRLVTCPACLLQMPNRAGDSDE